MDITKQQGIASLAIAVILMIAAALTIVFVAHRLAAEQRINTNAYMAQQAFEAAESGLEYGLEYLRTNKDTILVDADANGYIDNYYNTDLPNVSITYSNPIANDFDLIQIQATGISSDNTTQRTIKQLINFAVSTKSLLSNPIIARGGVELSGNALISNPQGLITIQCGSNITIGGSGETNATNGSQTYSSDKNFIDADVQQNQAELANMSPAELFEQYFGVSQATLKSQADYYYEGTGNYSGQLDNKQDAIIWIDKPPGQDNIDVTLIGNITIGTPNNPVVLIVNGGLYISGCVIIYGLIFAEDVTEVGATGNPNIYGGLITASEVKVGGSTQIIYDSSSLAKYKKVASKFSKIPGSWIDF